MTRSLLLLAIWFEAVAGGTPAQAQQLAQHSEDYPWCAIYAKDGDTHCFFTSYEQCMATVSGIGGFCQRLASAPAAPSRPRPMRGR
jgi:uncharacterized protein DUF3551